MTNKDIINEIDELLADCEDVLHGEVGNKVTLARKRLQALNIPDIEREGEQFYCDERDKYGNTDCTQQCMACVRDEQAEQ